MSLEQDHTRTRAAVAKPRRDVASGARWSSRRVESLSLWGSIVLGLALAASSIMGFLQSHHLAHVLVAGEAELLIHEIRAELASTSEPTKDDLERLLREWRGDWFAIAMLDAEGATIMEAGERRPLVPARTPPASAKHADRPPPPLAAAARGLNDDLTPSVVVDWRAGVAQAARPFTPVLGPSITPRASTTPPGTLADATVLLQFRPRMAHELRGIAMRNLVAGLAVAFMVVALAFALSRAHQAARGVEAQLVSQRHLAGLGEMSAVLAHEIRNPLASLKGHAQLLEALKDADPRITAKAARILGEVGRIETLTTRLLDLVRVGEIARVATDPAALVRAVAARKPFTIAVDVTASPHRWPLDASRIEQVLENLLDNAHQANPSGEVLVVVQQRGNMLTIEVLDRGDGVQEEVRDRVFEPFVTTRAQGTGLGLAIVRRIVELHGGHVALHPRPGGGTIAAVSIPSTP